MLGESGQPDIPLGIVDLVVLDRNEERVWLACVIKNTAGHRIGQFIGPSCGIRIADLPPPNKGGAPKKVAEHMALCLAWRINYELKSSVIAADMETMRQFHRKGTGRLAEIRRAFEQKVKHRIVATGPDRVAVFIERPTVYRDGQQYTVLGLGWAWHSRLGNVAVHGALKIEGTPADGELLPLGHGSILLIQR